MKLCRTAIGMTFTAGMLGLSGLCAAQTCSGPPPSIAIAKTADLNFGSLTVSGSTGTAVVDPSTGNRTVTGGVSQIGASGFNAAGFSVLLCGAGGPKRFDIVLPSGSITLNGSSGGTMTVDTFTSSPSGSGIGASTSTPTPFTVGATLHVGGNQTSGDYSGVFSVTVVRQ
jgi:Domain of unknown function (DUF4402)